MDQPFLPYGRQNITEEDISAVAEVLRSDFLTTGPKVAEFENDFGNYVGADHCVAVANGTAALHLACLALGVSPGDIVLTPAMSFAASTNGAAYCGARPRFVDCDPESGLITPQTFQDAIVRCQKAGEVPKLAVVVHLTGEMVDIEAISEIAHNHKIALIEDACHALGSQYVDSAGNTQTVGNSRFSDCTCFSTHPVKTMTTGEGGLVTCRDAKLADMITQLRMHGMVRDPGSMERHEYALSSSGKQNPWYYEIQSLGYNYRLTDFACALGISQLGRINSIATSRKRLKEKYDALFASSNLPLSVIPTPEGSDPVRHLYPVLIDFEGLGVDKADFVMALRELGVGTQVHYVPTHILPLYAQPDGDTAFPGAMEYYRKALSLPLYPELTDADLQRVVDAIGDVFEKLVKT